MGGECILRHSAFWGRGSWDPRSGVYDLSWAGGRQGFGGRQGCGPRAVVCKVHHGRGGLRLYRSLMALEPERCGTQWRWQLCLESCLARCPWRDPGTSQGSPLFPCCRSKLPALPHFPLLSTFSLEATAASPPPSLAVGPTEEAWCKELRLSGTAQEMQL